MKLEKKSVSGMMQTLLVVSMLTLAFNIQPVKAAGGTIYIRADGSVDPPTAPISNVGNVYSSTASEVTPDTYTITITGASKENTHSKEITLIISEEYLWQMDRFAQSVDIEAEGTTYNRISMTWIKLGADIDLRKQTSQIWTNVCWLIREQDAWDIRIMDMTFNGDFTINGIERNSEGTYVYFKMGGYSWQGIIKTSQKWSVGIAYKTKLLSTQQQSQWIIRLSKSIKALTETAACKFPCNSVEISFILQKDSELIAASAPGLSASFSSVDGRTVVVFEFYNGNPMDHSPYEVKFVVALAIPGREVPEKAPDFFEGVLNQLNIAASKFALEALKAWTSYENTNAYWNPLATTWDMGEKSWNFNAAGVKNYIDKNTGIQATANTLSLDYYKAIRDMLAMKYFDELALREAVANWSGLKPNDQYVVNLVNDWDELYQKTASELRDKINRELQRRVEYPLYVLNADSFTSAVTTVWMKFTDWATQTYLTEIYDELYWAGIDFDNMRLNALIKARDLLKADDIVGAQKYLERSYTYDRLSAMSFSAANEVFVGNLAAGEILAEGIKEGCEASVKFGLSVINPTAAKVADYIYLGLDYAVDSVLYGQEQAIKNAIVKVAVTTIFNEVKFEALGGRTIAEYTKNRIGKYMFPMLKEAFESEELQAIYESSLEAL